jgi:hypothetical protein
LNMKFRQNWTKALLQNQELDNAAHHL